MAPSSLRPERAATNQPRAERHDASRPAPPGWRAHHAHQALKGRNSKPPEIVPPFQGLSRGWAFYPGRRSTTFVVSLCLG